MSAAYPLLCQPQQNVLFRLPDYDVAGDDFLRAAHRVADTLPDAGFVINACQHRLWFTVAFAAALLRNQVTLLCSDRSPEQLRALVDRYPRLHLVTDDPRDDCPVPRTVLTPFPLPASSASLAMPSIAADTLAAIVFTSGSTGSPVPHRKTWGMLVERSIDAAACFDFTQDRPSNVVGMVPAQHMYGFETTVLLPLHVPVATWCDVAFYPQDVATALRSVPEPRVLVTTPLQIGTLLRASIDLPPLHRIISATAPLARDVAEAAERQWDTQVHEIFGATEVGSIASRRTTQDDVWQTYPHVRLAQLGPAEDQSVAVSAPFAAPYPLNDLVEQLDDRRFRLLGRRADMIKLGGRRASLSDLNRILNGIDGVIDGQFVAPSDLDTQPNARLQVFAVAPERDANDILAELRRRIDPLFLPRRVILVDRLPRNDTGKLTEAAIAALQATQPDR
jgi:acyl-coenzyme A synthetase/AMP-(fatty) acid ligase